MKVFVVLAVCIAAVLSEGGYPSEYGSGRYSFNGHYGGACGNDGFYYKDHYSFVICSNGNAYEQPCAPGSRNSGYDKFRSGGHYYYRDFCDVNLVDYGAGIPHHGAGYGHREAGYGYGHEAGYGGYGREAGYGGYGREVGYDGYRGERFEGRY